MVKARRKDSQNRQSQSPKNFKDQLSTQTLNQKPKTIKENIRKNQDWQGRAGQIDYLETIMGGINSSRFSNGPQRRAKWKPPAQLDRTKRECRYCRSEQVGYTSQRCPLLHARNLNKKYLRSNSIVLAELDPSAYEEEDMQKFGELEIISEKQIFS